MTDWDDTDDTPAARTGGLLTAALIVVLLFGVAWEAYRRGRAEGFQAGALVMKGAMLAGIDRASRRAGR